MAKQTDTPERLLDSAACLAKKVLRECETTRNVEDTNLWVFALFAKQISSVAAVRLLVNAGQPWDAALLVRSMYDAFFQIVYILRSDKSRDELLELFAIEMAVDDFEELKFIAILGSTSIDRLKKRNSFVRPVASALDAAKAHPAFYRRRGWPKRWRRVSNYAMKQVVRGQRLWTKQLDYLVTFLGDAAAHSRYAALKTFTPRNSAGGLSITIEPRAARVLDPEVRIMCAFLCILLTTDTIVDQFGFGDPLAASVRRLHKKWLAMANQDGMKQPG